MDIRNDMLRLLNGRRQGFSLEQPFYTAPDYFKLDMELIWYRDWLFIGHDCELPKPGSYITAQIGDYPVVLVRDQQGKINAFHNSCRHRGSRVCNTEKGTAAKQAEERAEKAAKTAPKPRRARAVRPTRGVPVPSSSPGPAADRPRNRSRGGPATAPRIGAALVQSRIRSRRRCT